jgi:two-component system chemotaxis response regulator CheY
MTILIVDDGPLIRLSLSRAFKSQGDTVHVAEDGLLGEQAWKTHNPDIVVLDVLMPGLTGPQLIEKLKPTSTAKIVLISAFSGDYGVDSVKKLGADLFIAKPFADIFEVVKRVRELVQK